MPQIKVYHNPHFLEYRGRHSDIAPPVRPVATVQIPAEMAAEQALEIAFRQTQHVYMLFGIDPIFLHSWLKTLEVERQNGYQLGKIPAHCPTRNAKGMVHFSDPSWLGTKYVASVWLCA